MAFLIRNEYSQAEMASETLFASAGIKNENADRLRGSRVVQPQTP